MGFPDWKTNNKTHKDMNAEEWEELRNYYIDMLNDNQYCESVKQKLIKKWFLDYDKEFGFYY
tara:strand:- start:31 stop:216 length:186 start_codon:yes stop_codon:yes gene_type:complete